MCIFLWLVVRENVYLHRTDIYSYHDCIKVFTCNFFFFCEAFVDFDVARPLFLYPFFFFFALWTRCLWWKSICLRHNGKKVLLSTWKRPGFRLIPLICKEKWKLHYCFCPKWGRGDWDKISFLLLWVTLWRHFQFYFSPSRKTSSVTSEAWTGDSPML